MPCIASPRRISGRYRARCSGVPCISKALACTAAPARGASARSITSRNASLLARRARLAAVLVSANSGRSSQSCRGRARTTGRTRGRGTAGGRTRPCARRSSAPAANRAPRCGTALPAAPRSYSGSVAVSSSSRCPANSSARLRAHRPAAAGRGARGESGVVPRAL